MSKISKESKQQKILIGWASRDITPDKTAELFGQFHVRISEYINDPLTVTALAFECGDTSEQGIMVSIDAAYVKNSIRDKCCEKLSNLIPDFNSGKLFINATHTHTAPSQPPSLYPPQAPEVMTPDEYSEILVKGHY